MASSIAEFSHLQIPLEDIEKATNNFSKKRIIGGGEFGNVYRGKPMWSGELIKISARRLDRRYGQGDVEFWTEVSMLSSMKHKNIVSMIGYCDEKGEKIIVYHHYAKGSLSMHISNPILTWKQRFDICHGIASAIEYIHHKMGRSYYVIHRNINSSTILLDKNWEPKLSGFEFSIKHPVDRMNQVFISKPIGTYGYIDPDIYESGGVTHKTDIYSLGVVLPEIMCGRTAKDDSTFPAILSAIITKQTESVNGTGRIEEQIKILKDAIHPDLLNQLGTWKSDNIFSLYTLFLCVLPRRSYRQDADRVVDACLQLSKGEEKKDIQTLDTKANSELEPVILDGNDETDEDDDSHLTIREIGYRDEIESGLYNPRKGEKNMPTKTPAHLTFYKNINVNQVKNLGHLRIQLKEIRLAIDRRRTSYPHELGTRYVTQLKCFDSEYPYPIEDKRKSELPKKNYHVDIICIRDREDIFKREIEVLRTCKHRNIHNLLGFCDKDRNMILVYEGTNGLPLSSSQLFYYVTWKESLETCVAVARGLDYLQNTRDGHTIVVHRDINSDNIMRNDPRSPIIIGFQHSVILPKDQDNDSVILPKDQDNDGFNPSEIVGKKHYIDPEYAKTGKFNKESDIFSLGVVMFEIFCGRLVSTIMSDEGHEDEGLTQLVQRWVDEGIIKKKLAPLSKQENVGNKNFLPKGPNKDSLDTFLSITSQCLKETHDQRPQIEVVLKELEKALHLQENHKDLFRMSFEEINKATKNFSKDNRIGGGGGFGGVYRGTLIDEHGKGHVTIAAKRLDKSQGQGEQQFYNELQILYEYKHDNIIGLLGYSNEADEKIIVYEHAPKGSLDRYLGNAGLTWRNRLKICINIATGLAFIHGGIQGQNVVIHRDLKSANILLFEDWNAKVGDFGLSLISAIDKETNFTFDHPCGTMGYLDPMYLKSKILTVESEVYSFGVLLFEILYGKEAYKISKPKSESLLDYIKHNFEQGKQEEIVFKYLKKEIMPKSLTTFMKIVQECLADEREKRPTSKEVLLQLTKALELQDEDVQDIGTDSRSHF